MSTESLILMTATAYTPLEARCSSVKSREVLRCMERLNVDHKQLPVMFPEILDKWFECNPACSPEEAIKDTMDYLATFLASK